MFRKAASVLTLLLAGTVFSYSQNKEKNPDIDPTVNIALDARVDGQAIAYSGDPQQDAKFGFGGKFITLIVDGSITDKLTYAYRQRLFMQHAGPKEFFNATDWLYLKYRFHKNFAFSFGKEVINVGGFEYDMNPIDVYFYSGFCQNLNAAYQFGATLTYISNDERHNLKAQVTNSPFAKESFDGLLAYNLMWVGNMDWFRTMYSVNLVERVKGHYFNYIALGNKFTFNPVTIDLDYTNRYALASAQKGFFSDFSLTCNVSVALCDKWNIFVKGSYDQNLGQEEGVTDPYDTMVLPGTQYAIYGAGVEFFPLEGKRDLRLHAFWYSDNTKPVPNCFNIGVRWRMKVFSNK